jgi:hypothetical protein
MPLFIMDWKVSSMSIFLQAEIILEIVKQQQEAQDWEVTLKELS